MKLPKWPIGEMLKPKPVLKSRSWRERKALRRLEECRPSLLDSLEAILDADEGDIALARVRFEAQAAEAGLDLDLPGISGRVHGLF